MPQPFVLSLILAMFLAIALLSVAARRLGWGPPLIMLVAGIAIDLVPGVPSITLDPDLMLLGLLPPLLYSSGVGMSWRGFRSNLRPILSMAVGCVLFTASAVAALVHYAFGVSWAAGFVLGAIVSPPDSVAPSTLLRSFRLPRRLQMVLEGESLVNDATALVTFSFAVRAVETNAFSPSLALLQFVAIVGGEIAFGAAVGSATLRLRHFANDPRAEILIALVTPFLSFWPPHLTGGSGVVACFSTGLYVSWNGRNYIRPATRLQGFFIWDLVTWCVEALTFFICGLQMRETIGRLSGVGWSRFVAAGVAVSIAVIVVRFLWVFPVTYLPRWLWPPLRRREQAPNWKPAFLVGFAGLRGAVSLAAALSIPLVAGAGPFPYRDLILFTTICVILATLLGQGLALGRVVRWLDLGRIGAREAAANRRAENEARVAALDAVLSRLDAKPPASAAERSATSALRHLQAERKSKFLSDLKSEMSSAEAAEFNALRLDLIAVERAAIGRSYEENRITDEARRRLEREFDLEEASLRHGINEESN